MCFKLESKLRSSESWRLHTLLSESETRARELQTLCSELESKLRSSTGLNHCLQTLVSYHEAKLREFGQCRTQEEMAARVLAYINEADGALNETVDVAPGVVRQSVSETGAWA